MFQERQSLGMGGGGGAEPGLGARAAWTGGRQEGWGDLVRSGTMGRGDVGCVGRSCPRPW